MKKLPVKIVNGNGEIVAMHRITDYRQVYCETWNENPENREEGIAEPATEKELSAFLRHADSQLQPTV